MKRKLPPFPALRAFEAAARLGSFQEAGAELCVTASAISHQVRTLETFLERRLFERGTRQITPTEEGRLYLARVGPLLDELDASTRLIAGEACAGPLRVKATEGFTKRWLIPRLSDFLARYPEIEVRIETGVPPTDFHDGQRDVVIHWGDDPMPGVEVQPFMSSSRTPMCSPRYLARNPDLTDPKALLGKTLIRDQVGDGWEEWFSLIGAGDVCPAGGPEFAHCELGMTAAESDLGVTLGYIAMIGETLERGTLVTPFGIESPTRTIYSVAYPPERAKDARIVAFRDWLFERMLHNTLPESQDLRAAQ
ncbi:LysR substrate-binding domain-containing protein [Roseovarius ramblicola]|uniref:LysR substrate-binding domain-containing protein n=1 Tax=Roseovarius ramblicola TaxID=2022336 RepID=A0ABV5HYZ1_9RHOB